MALSLGLANLILFFVAGLLLYHYSGTFRYYYKICFIVGWMLGMSFVVLPVVALRGRNVNNAKVLRFVMLPLKYIVDVKISVLGTRNLDVTGPFVVVSNQQGNVDLLGLFQILPERCILIVKKGLFYMLAVGVVCWLSGFIFIDRKKTGDANSIRSAAVDAMIRDNLRIWVFVDNTKNSLLPFKHGPFQLAVQAQVPVIPVVMSSYEQFLNKKTKKFTPGEVTIRILPPVKTEGLGQADVPELAEHVQETMLSTFHEISGGAEKQE